MAFVPGGGLAISKRDAPWLPSSVSCHRPRPADAITRMQTGKTPPSATATRTTTVGTTAGTTTARTTAGTTAGTSTTVTTTTTTTAKAVHSRRSVLAAAAATAAAAAAGVVPGVRPAAAADLQPYKDIAKGFSIMRPTAWNEFDASEDQYDVKWQDIIQPLEFVTVLTSPVSKGKTIQNVGPVDAVGEKVAAGRGGQLVAAAETAIDGVPAYVFEIKKGPAHQITLLTITKSKLYAVNASAPEQRWSRRQQLLRAVVDSFRPKL